MDSKPIMSRVSVLFPLRRDAIAIQSHTKADTDWPATRTVQVPRSRSLSSHNGPLRHQSLNSDAVWPHGTHKEITPRAQACVSISSNVVLALHCSPRSTSPHPETHEAWSRLIPSLQSIIASLPHLLLQEASFWLQAQQTNDPCLLTPIPPSQHKYITKTQP